MNVALIATHQISMDTEVPLTHCVGVLALAAALHEQGIESTVIDLVDFNNSANTPFDDILESVLARIEEISPAILAISTMSNNLIIAAELCRVAKERIPDVFAILGGPGVSFCAAEVLNAFPYLDAIIRGEADFAFPELVSAFLKGNEVPQVKGLVYRSEDRLIDYGWPDPITDLDSLPMPLYALCGSEAQNESNAIYVEIGRGCPYSCIFCSTSSFFKRHYRVKSVRRVLSEIEYIESNLGQSEIAFNHDLLTFNREYILELCNSLESKYPDISWSCSARLDTIDEELLRVMKSAGCTAIFLGIEVATERMQDAINKRLNLGRLHDILQTIVDIGMEATLSFITGIPGVDAIDAQEMLSLVFAAKSVSPEAINIQIHSLAPEQGSSLFPLWKDKLVYDEYGCVGHSDIPLNWTRQRALIRDHPDIFSVYFYINIPKQSREETLRHVYLSHLLDVAAVYSLYYAYLKIGEKLPKHLSRVLNKIEIPPPSWPITDYKPMMTSLQNIVRDVLIQEDIDPAPYIAISEWEKAARIVLDRRPEHSIESILVQYDPVALIEDLQNRRNLDESFEMRERCLAVFWDKEDSKMKQAEIPKALAGLFSH